MASPPNVTKISTDDLSGDWGSDSVKLLSRLNNFIADSNTLFSGGTSLVQNLGCQALDFTVQVPSAWQTLTLLNGWVNIGAVGDNVASYRKDVNGVVWLRGNISTGTISAVVPLGILPAGYRPSGSMRLPVNSNSAFGRYAVDTSGNIFPTVGSNASYSLESGGFACSDLSPYIPSCFPVNIRCTLPYSKASAILPAEIIDVTPNSPPVVFSAGAISWHNSSGNISIDNIPGLLPNRTYSIKAYAFPLS